LVDQMPVPEVSASSMMSDVTADRRGESAGWPGAWPSPEQLVRRAQLRALGTSSGLRFDRPRDTQVPLGLPQRADAAATQVDTLVAGTVGGATQETDWDHEPQSASTPESPVRGGQLPFLRVVGQLGLTYVVAEGPEGMYLIDQHGAHERVIYEKLMRESAQARVPSQVLLEPELIELTPEGIALVEEGLQTLLVLGFDVEPFGSNTVLVRAVPALLVNTDLSTVFEEIVADLQVGDEPLASGIEARIVRRVCKQAAIKAGQPLSQQEMDELIRQLEACASPRTCPHGRPTMIHLSAVQLAQEFGRLG
jgi:DNA mismatch repair protein MutL